MKKAIVVIMVLSMSLNVLAGWAIEDESIDFDGEQPIQVEEIKTDEFIELNIEDGLNEIMFI